MWNKHECIATKFSFFYTGRYNVETINHLLENHQCSGDSVNINQSRIINTWIRYGGGGGGCLCFELISRFVCWSVEETCVKSNLLCEHWRIKAQRCHCCTFNTRSSTNFWTALHIYEKINTALLRKIEINSWQYRELKPKVSKNVVKKNRIQKN